MTPSTLVPHFDVGVFESAPHRGQRCSRLFAAGLMMIGLMAFHHIVRAQQQPKPAYQSFSDTSAAPDEAAVREALESLRYQIISDPELAVALPAPSQAASGASQLPQALLEQMRASRERSIAQIQKMIDETDPTKNPDQRKQLEAALERTKASYAELLSGKAPASSVGSPPTGSTASAPSGWRIPASGDRQPDLSEALANLKRMLRDNSSATAIAAFEQSEDYSNATRASANAAAAVMLKRPMAALAGLLRAQELEVNNPAHLINLAGLAASFEMPRHSLALLEAAEKLLPAANPNAFELGGLKARAVLLTTRGRTLIHVKRFPEAEGALREAVRLEPSLAEARINLAHALYQQADEKKKAEAITTMMFARYRVSSPPSSPTGATPPPSPQGPSPAEPDTSQPEHEDSEEEEVAQSGRRLPARALFDLSIGKTGHLPTIKIPRKIADGHAMWKKIHDLQQETIAQMSSMGTKMNELWDKMRDRERAGDMPRISGDRARDIFWYISNAHREPEVSGLFREYNEAMRDEGNGTFGGQLSNPFASHELEKKVDEIMARDQPWPEKVKDLYDATEPYHGSWQGLIHDLETDTHRLAEAYYKHSTAIAAHLSDPVHHEYANLLIRTRTLSYFSGYLTALETVARFDYNNIESWSAIYGPGQAEDPTDGEFPESDWCPAVLKGEYKVKASVKIFEVSVNCEKIGFQIAAGHWVKAFAEVESTWKGDKSIFVGSAVEAALPGGGPSAEAKSGFFVNVNAEGDITDFGLKSSDSTGIGVGPVGYEREVESTFSLMSVLSSPPT